MSVNLLWVVPPFAADAPEYKQIQIYRGSDENDVTTYSLLATISRLDANGNEVTSYTDSDPAASRTFFYFIRYYDPVGLAQSPFALTLFELTPKDQRWVN